MMENVMTIKQLELKVLAKERLNMKSQLGYVVSVINKLQLGKK
jgi:hypothetical protein